MVVIPSFKVPESGGFERSRGGKIKGSREKELIFFWTGLEPSMRGGGGGGGVCVLKERAGTKKNPTGGGEKGCEGVCRELYLFCSGFFGILVGGLLCSSTEMKREMLPTEREKTAVPCTFLAERNSRFRITLGGGIKITYGEQGREEETLYCLKKEGGGNH